MTATEPTEIRARYLHQDIAEHMRQVDLRMSRHLVSSTPKSPLPSREIQAARRLVADPRSARQAILASVILGPPKALEEDVGAAWQIR
jgi:hypothetical protein